MQLLEKMNNIYNLLKLIRYKNLLIIILIQSILKFMLIDIYLLNTALSTTNFIFYLFALITIVSSGYIINDICDIEIDKINKKEKLIIEKKITTSTAFKTYYLLNFLGIMSGFYVAYNIEHFWLGLIFVYITISLWIYSKQQKKSFLTGNLQVAFLSALSIFNLALYDLIPIENVDGLEIVLLIIILYSVFAFLTTLIREIIKDIEDIEGDKKAKANTLPIKYGIQKTKNIAISLNLIVILGIGYLQYFQYSTLTTFLSEEYWGANYISIAYTLLLQIPLIILIIKIYSANNKTDFHNASMITKYIMIIGILSIPVFTYTHI